MAPPKLETRKGARIAYIEHQGPYDKIPWSTYIERLYGWAKSQKVMPGFYPMGIFKDQPNAVPAGKLRCEVAITFKGDADEKDGIKIRSLPEMKVAAFSFKGPGAGYSKAYKDLGTWISEKGYEPSGPAIEIYSKRPEVVNGVTILYAKIMLPVKKK